MRLSMLTRQELALIFGKPAVHLLIILIIGLFSYSNTLHSPFQTDEEGYLRENPVVKDIFAPSETVKGLRAGELYKSLMQRYVAFFTFALNYKVHGFAVEGYHVVNIAIHLSTALLVYLLVWLSFRTPVLRVSVLSERSGLIAFFTALLFVSHPVQTEAVTYIWQRLTSLAAFFYLLSLVLYAAWRLERPAAAQAGPARSRNGRIAVFYLGSLLAAVLAMKTKEHAFTLPFVLLLYEFFFFLGPAKKRLLRLIPHLLTALIIPLTTVMLLKGMGRTLGQLTATPESLTGMDYFLTELRVIVTYLRLLIAPVHQNFWYDYPKYHSFWQLPIVLSLSVILALAGYGAYCWYRSRTADAGYRFAAFGIFWFFITLSVESSIIPLPFVINEYRLYLPSIGLIAAAVFLAVFFAVKSGSIGMEILLWMLLTTAGLTLAAATHARNDIWKDNVVLWKDVVRKSPGLGGAHKNLGYFFMKNGQLEEAAREFKLGMQFGTEHAEARLFLGKIYAQTGRIEEAIEEYAAAVRLKPGNVDAHYQLGTLYTQKELFPEAIAEYRKVLTLSPDHVGARVNLGGVLAQSGRYREALQELRAALKMDPGNEDIRYNLGLVAGMKRQRERAGH